MNYITFPWEQLGRVLRRLSLSGGTGNAAAWIIYLTIGALPLGAVLFLRHRRKACKVDFLLPVLSAALWAGLWFFVNPSYMNRYLSPVPASGVAGYALAAVIDSLLLTWFLLRCVLSCEKMGRARLLSGLRLLLGVYAVLSAVAILWQGSAQFLEECDALREGNTATAGFLVTVSLLFLGLQTLAGLLPGLSELALLLMASGFLGSYGKDAYGEETCAKMERLRQASGWLLKLILLATLGSNVLQLLFSRFILSSYHRIVFPLTELLVLLGIRMFSFLYLEGKRLKEDNDMFI